VRLHNEPAGVSLQALFTRERKRLPDFRPPAAAAWLVIAAARPGFAAARPGFAAARPGCAAARPCQRIDGCSARPRSPGGLRPGVQGGGCRRASGESQGLSPGWNTHREAWSDGGKA